MRRLALLIVVLFAKEAHVSGGYAECFTDLGSVVCVESDSRKRFVDAEQAREWIGEHRVQAEQRLHTVVPLLRAALHDVRAAGLPIAVVDDWRLSSTAVAADASRPRRVQLELGTFERQIVNVTVTTTRALTDAESATLLGRLKAIIEAPAPTTGPGEAIAAWQPVWIAEPKVVDHVRLGIGTARRVSPLAAKTWTPWLQAQLTALRASWSKQPCALPRGLTTTATTQTTSHYREVDGFRPWGPLLLDNDVQARVDDDAIVRMARLVLPAGQKGDVVYGDLTHCLTKAAPPLPAPPAPAP